MDVKIRTRELDDVTVIDVSGRITLGDETSALRKTVREVIARGKKKIVLNLADVSYIDSSGVGELVASYTAVRNAGGELKLLNLTKKVHDLLQITKLYTIFDIKDDEFMAIKSFDWYFAK
ncbi:MAG TPA: STAS domain-containing protein [Terriglobales bacterium]|nr:STAS domain-containing protein [Terriglobales bacterium]